MGLPTAAPVERPSRAAAEYKKEKLEQKKRKTEQGLGALSGRVYNRDPEAGYQPDIRRNKESDTSETDIEEKKEKITEKLEFGKRTAKSDEISSTIELLTDEKAQNKRNNVRSSSENTYSQLSSKEKEFEQRVVKAKDELENINKKLEDLKREIAQYYEITADIDIDENNNLIGVGDIDSNLAPRDRSKATKARGELIKAIHKVKEAEEKFENAKDEKFSGGEILQKEVQNMLGSMENLGPQERKR